MNTAKINISNKYLNCDKIVDLLLKEQIISNTQVNKSIQCLNNLSQDYSDKKKICWIEHGCLITLPFNSPKEITKTWNILKTNLSLTCAHLEISGKFKGCILDWERESLCK